MTRWPPDNACVMRGKIYSSRFRPPRQVATSTILSKKAYRKSQSRSLRYVIIWLRSMSFVFCLPKKMHNGAMSRSTERFTTLDWSTKSNASWSSICFWISSQLASYETYFADQIDICGGSANTPHTALRYTGANHQLNGKFHVRAMLVPSRDISSINSRNVRCSEPRQFGRTPLGHSLSTEGSARRIEERCPHWKEWLRSQGQASARRSVKQLLSLKPYLRSGAPSHTAGVGLVWPHPWDIRIMLKACPTQEALNSANNSFASWHIWVKVLSMRDHLPYSG